MGAPERSAKEVALERGHAKAPAGFEWEWKLEQGIGRFAFVALEPGEESRPCRFMEDRSSCKAPSVAKMQRGVSSSRWWHYCNDHLYGRVLHDGKLWSLRLREVES